MSSRVLHPESLAIGLAIIRFAEYSLHIANSGVSLDTSNSVGYVASANITKLSEKLTRSGSMAGRVFEAEAFTKAESVSVDCAFKELTISNLDVALGGGGTLSSTGSVSGEISLSESDSQVYYRVEVEIMLKDNLDMVTFILPKCRVTSSLSITTNVEDLAGSPLQFTTIPAYEGIWFDNPIGKIVSHR